MSAIYHYILGATLLFGAAPAIFAQSNADLAKLEAEYRAYSNELLVVAGAIDSLKRQISERSKRIETIENPDSRGYLEQRKLEKILQESQRISTQVAKLEKQQRTVSEKLERNIRLLRSGYESMLEMKISAISAAESSEDKQEQYAALEGLRNRLYELKSQNQEAQYHLDMPALAISSEDSPAKIRQKADLLKDQEDKIRLVSLLLLKRRNDFKKELKLRVRLDDLMTDLALFDQQDEYLANFSAPKSAAVYSSDRIEVDLTSASTKTLYFDVKQPFNYKSLSIDEVEYLIKDLAQQEEILRAKADSLSSRAIEFYKAADELKKSN